MCNTTIPHRHSIFWNIPRILYSLPLTPLLSPRLLQVKNAT